MKSQPNSDYDSNDVVMTPLHLAQRIVEHFKPEGRILEPCAGSRNFVRFMPGCAWCEITEGSDFFAWTRPVEWIITNPPWSQVRKFLQHSMSLADEIVFLMTVNHCWTKARVRDVKQSGFGIKEICLVEFPPEFPSSGFQLGAIHFSRGWEGGIRFSDISLQDPLEGTW